AQIPKKWLTQHVTSHPELATLEKLLIASQRGLKFSTKTALLAKQYFEKIEKSEPFEQYLNLFALLREMSKDPFIMLSSSTFCVSAHT
ncbi:hypothetical protein ACKI2C_50120, partial [Streptomyces brasiliscabiei]|uniref:hypothetical protein n=1 Tax=Streptomyces brasiliscabiei TaxID=2736302 RepID=UPI0038F66494